MIMKTSDLLKAMLEANHGIQITISGSSMCPIIYDGQKVTVSRAEHYTPGDIVIFQYKNEGLLAHRLLKIINGRLFCKGDNSFRIEDITEEQIIGTVILNNDRHNDLTFIEASYSIGKLFKKCRYNSEILRSHPQYVEYAKLYLGE